MLVLGAASTSARVLDVGLVATAFVFGLRHGVDWDHLAAISDLTGAQSSRRRSLMVASGYALGHAAVVFGLGAAAILFSARLPTPVAGVMERVVGVTLLLLGGYVLVSLARHGRDMQMRSRWMLLIAIGRRAVAALRRRVHADAADVVVIEHDHPHRHGDEHTHTFAGSPPAVPLHDHVHPEAPCGDVRERRVAVAHRHRHRHVVAMPADPFAGAPGPLGAVGVGVLHGVGAETPTQVAVFVGAAGVAGAVSGLVVLAAFVAGLLVSNTVIALASTLGILGSGRRGRLFLAVSALTAAFSLVVGGLFLSGQAGALPAVFGG